MTAGEDRLRPGETLGAGQQISSAGNVLVMQADGNLVYYAPGGIALWSSGTNGRGGVRAVMQADGNFVVYTATNTPLWSSGTDGNPGAYVVMQGDGNVVIYVAGGGRAPWATHTEIKTYAVNQSAMRGWGRDQWGCLDQLWIKESNWNPRAENPSSGAYGIPQALPGNKMAAEGGDWQTNPQTQIRWGLNYIRDRYGNPCSAWSWWQSHKWY